MVGLVRPSIVAAVLENCSEGGNGLFDGPDP